MLICCIHPECEPLQDGLPAATRADTPPHHKIELLAHLHALRCSSRSSHAARRRHASRRQAGQAAASRQCVVPRIPAFLHARTLSLFRDRYILQTASQQQCSSLPSSPPSSPEPPLSPLLNSRPRQPPCRHPSRMSSAFRHPSVCSVSLTCKDQELIDMVHLETRR